MSLDRKKPMKRVGFPKNRKYGYDVFDAEAEFEKLRKPFPAKRVPVKARNERRIKEKFARNFGSKERVEFAKTRTCYCCRKRRAVVNAHVVHARGMGGAGGTFLDVTALCEVCDRASTARPKSFWVEVGIDPADIAAEFEGDWLDHIEDEMWAA